MAARPDHLIKFDWCDKISNLPDAPLSEFMFWWRFAADTRNLKAHRRSNLANWAAYVASKPSYNDRVKAIR